jgi:Na+-driven multidrug efflux pump
VLTGGTTILAVGLVTLFAEVFKASGATRASLMDQMLSLLLFIVVLLEFLLWPAAGNSVFALLGLMTLVDVIAGFAVGMAVARRDVGIIRE